VRNKNWIIFLIIIVVGVVVYTKRDKQAEELGNNQPIQNQPQNSEDPNNTRNNPSQPQEQVIAEGLDTPWEIAFLPDQSILVTQRNGEIRIIGKDNQSLKIQGVSEVGEGGLLGMALHPEFSDNQQIYFYYTYRNGGKLLNKVESYKLVNNSLTEKKVIIENIPASSNHDGGRIAFGPDKFLYVTTGDADNSNSAQDMNSLSGKILRLKDDGTTPSDNPFNNPTYSYGHRNPQGLAWDDSGQLWATEHGPSGSQTGNDELNLIEKGKNYGWPEIRGDQAKSGMQTPVVNSGSKSTWAPASLAYLNGVLYFGGLRSQILYAAKIKSDGRSVELATLLEKKYGRLRAVTVGPDGYLYISTSNRDGRGNPKTGDDKVIKYRP
jgi:aldose sugar dehydrogenase